MCKDKQCPSCLRVRMIASNPYRGKVRPASLKTFNRLHGYDPDLVEYNKTL